jgi:hypothetical protein
MVSIVGFGRPKFKGAGAAPSTEQKIAKAKPEVCPTCGK